METNGEAGPHPGLKRLLAYREGSLPMAERETVQEHLSLCPRCTGLWREIRDFEAASARGDVGPEPLREKAWDSLARRLAETPPAVWPIAGVARRETPRRRFSTFLGAAAAALLLAVAGLTLWAIVTVFQDRQRLALLERRLAERDAAVAALQRTLTETERQLGEARAQVQGSAGAVDLSAEPRFALRGQETPASEYLRAGGAMNILRQGPQDGLLAVALSLEGQPDYPEYRLTLTDRQGRVLGTVRRPGSSFLGDAGTSVSIGGIGPGLYRLRVEGLPPEHGKLLVEYRLEVEPSASRR